MYGIILLAVFLRFYRLGYQSLWYDETLSIGTYSSPGGGISYWYKLLWDVHGPLYSLIMHFWSKIGSSDAWLRTPSAIAGVLAVYFMYRWIVLVADGKTALWGALLLALSPFNLYYSQEIRFYSLLTLFIIISLFTFQRFLLRPSRGSGVSLGLVMGLSALAHFMSLFLLAGLFFYLLFTGRLRGKIVKYGALAAVIAFIIVSPWLYREYYFLTTIKIVNISTLAPEEKLSGENTLNTWAYPYILYAFSTGFSFGPDLRELHLAHSGLNLIQRHGLVLLFSVLLFGGMLVRGIIRSARERLLSLFLFISLVTIVLTTITAMLNIKVFNVRYQMCIFPVFLTILALGISKGRFVGMALALLACAVMLLADWNYFRDPRYARDDFRSAAKIIGEEEGERDLILVTGFEDIFNYYYRGNNKRVASYFGSNMEEEEIEKLIASWQMEYNRIWYLRCRHWAHDPQDKFLHLLEHNLKMIQAHQLPGIRLMLFEPAVSR